MKKTIQLIILSLVALTAYFGFSCLKNKQEPVASSNIDYATPAWQLITKGQADTLVNQGAATSTYTVGEISRLGTQIEIASSTDKRLKGLEE